MAIDWMRDWTAWRGFTRHHKRLCVKVQGRNMYLDLINKPAKAVTIGIIAPYIIDILENSFKITTQKLKRPYKKGL
jgi:hypothetical protein